MGGFARRATLLKKEAVDGTPSILVDAGDFAEDKDFDAWGKTQFIFDMMARLGYNAVTPGERELLEGLQPLKDMYSKHSDVKVVSANLQDKSGQRIFPEYAILDRNGVKIGVTGVTGSSFYNFNVTRGIQKKDDFQFEDSEAALKRVVPELRKKADVVVVLLHEGPGDAKRIADEVPGMDVVLVGHNPGYMFNPDRTGQTLLLRPGTRGQYLSVLDLTLDAQNQIVDYNGEGKPLGDAVAKDPDTDAIVTKWEKDWENRKSEDKRKAAAKAAVIQGTEKYVGAETCARCHSEIYTAWAKTPHAKAFQTLVDAKKQNVAECVECHVTGYGEPTGYDFSVKADEAKQTAVTTDQAEMRNVQCESCHGMGTFHGTSAMVKMPTEATCQNCHTGDFAKDFDFAAAVKKVH